jgi:hypothetical protein
MSLKKQRTIRLILWCAIAVIALLAGQSARAQHIDYLLGGGGLLTAQQPPPSVYVNNEPSDYWAPHSNSLKRLDINTNLNMFTDIQTIGWTTPVTLPNGGHYGMSISIPTVVDTNGRLDVGTSNGLLGTGGNTTKIGTSSIYVEPINFGWHWPQFDSVAAVGFSPRREPTIRTKSSIPASAAGPRCFRWAAPPISIPAMPGRWRSRAVY